MACFNLECFVHQNGYEAKRVRSLQDVRLFDMAATCTLLGCMSKTCFKSSFDKQLDASTKLLRLQYLLFKALPVLRHIYGEQNYELAIESNLRGTPLTGKDITRSALGISERLYCYFIVSFVEKYSVDEYFVAFVEVALDKVKKTYGNGSPVTAVHCAEHSRNILEFRTVLGCA
ncbi:hypothetical protein RHSIM_Rhsim01G0173200 [Rhododendron simsii]|uniref:Uncharacterized protein n=1 Tax=Rhododendron simsii TaxID=118357 RepID=A0A834HJR5_RHOSS|nr:hypothetical protein RHSIM_Rhsim01G0173200 [Rhododendron simsii]